jgi:tRNA modification GTPase
VRKNNKRDGYPGSRQYSSRDNPCWKRGSLSVRLSGKDARSITEKIFNTQIKKTRTAYFIRTDIDDVVLIYYQAPASYTGEDVCEIFCHGNPFIVSTIIDKITSLKDHRTRLAEPGEFTKRAYLNDKMDLVQAETVAEIINAKNEKSLKIRNRMLKGDLSYKLNKIKNKLLSISSLMELEIDFEEERAGVFNKQEAVKELEELVNQIESVLSSSSHMEIFTKDIMVAIVGDTNVGKSSLFNNLVGKQRSIVHHIPGTTRDYIESTVNLGNFSVLFVDTAGFRSDPSSQVELEGIKRTSNLSDTALFIIEVFD